MRTWVVPFGSESGPIVVKAVVPVGSAVEFWNTEVPGSVAGPLPVTPLVVREVVPAKTAMPCGLLGVFLRAAWKLSVRLE